MIASIFSIFYFSSCVNAKIYFYLLKEGLVSFFSSNNIISSQKPFFLMLQFNINEEYNTFRDVTDFQVN
jgi:hypothetical protein